jgi:cation transport regulator ChaC
LDFNVLLFSAGRADALSAQARHFVFGYGSLTARPGLVVTRELKEDGFTADLAGLRRTWGVAMDNRRDLPGYKYYTDAAGRRPEVFVAYLDLVEAPEDSGAVVNGLCLPVDDAILAQLDRRERNYERTDVSDRVAADGATVWAYLGMAAARERLAEGRRTGTALIDRGYVRTVAAGFAVLGDDELAACRASLEPGDLPVADLTRHELP